MTIADIIDRAAPCPQDGTPMVVDVADMAAQPLKPVRVFEVWPPVRLQMDIWRDAQIDMTFDAAQSPRTTLLGRIDDSPGGCAFVTVSDAVCTLHGGIVLPARRRHGMGRYLMVGAARWAQDHGATTLALRCPPQARAFCEAIGMTPA